MLEKPNLADADILACLNTHYDLDAASLEFLTLGNDASAWVYRVNARDKTYFLKVRKGEPSIPVLSAPRFLKDSGIREVVAPLVTNTGRLWVSLGTFSLTLYPFVVGEVGMDVGLSNQQWHTFGRVLRQIHAVKPSPELEAQLRVETYSPPWTSVIQQIRDKIDAGVFKDDYERELAAFWNERREEIDKIIIRASELGNLTREQALPLVLCHADIHTANMLLTPEGDLQIVDWDGIMLAPKERDLMFPLEEVDGSQPFLEGYGAVEVNWQAIAYYRYEWVVQEIGDYGERVFLVSDTGEETLRDAVRGFQQLFDPGDVVDKAYEADTQR